jgi:acetyl-CoA carboxylase biotin carboxyl carrier protein
LIHEEEPALEFRLKQDFKIRLREDPSMWWASVSYEDAPVLTYVQPTVAVPTPGMAGQTPAVAAAALAASLELEIKSPMIGTFYRAPSPESASYIEVGAEVNPETVVCIIEAMKVMNEIKAEAKGIITQVLVENAKPVELANRLQVASN